MAKMADKDQEAHKVHQEVLDFLETLAVKDPQELKVKKVYQENQVSFVSNSIKF